MITRQKQEGRRKANSIDHRILNSIHFIWFLSTRRILPPYHFIIGIIFFNLNHQSSPFFLFFFIIISILNLLLLPFRSLLFLWKQNQAIIMSSQLLYIHFSTHKMMGCITKCNKLLLRIVWPAKRVKPFCSASHNSMENLPHLALQRVKSIFQSIRNL